MAHGGDSIWNASVSDAAARLDPLVPTAIAFGMATPSTMQAALDSLSARGSDRVAVVRLFISGRSVRPQSDYLLGLSDRHPGWFMTAEGVDPRSVEPIAHDLRVDTHGDGLMSSEHARRIVLERVQSVSRTPADESVLIIAHGMGDEAENAEVVDAMMPIAERLRDRGFSAVDLETLREDWPDERAAAEERIRGFVARESEAGRTVIVVPFRLSGFGPYASVLEGLDYVPTQGLLPHRLVTYWIVEKAAGLLCDGEPGGCGIIQPR